MNKREEANYKTAKFSEPGTPEHFEKVISVGLRRAINTYLDNSSAYLFDKDHAILAYPVKTLQITYKKLSAFQNLEFHEDEIQYLSGLFKDEKGPISVKYKLLSQTKN